MQTSEFVDMIDGSFSPEFVAMERCRKDMEAERANVSVKFFSRTSIEGESDVVCRAEMMQGIVKRPMISCFVILSCTGYSTPFRSI